MKVLKISRKNTLANKPAVTNRVNALHGRIIKDDYSTTDRLTRRDTTPPLSRKK